jgi:hypothetical protein
MARNLRIGAFKDALEETVHVISPKRRNKGTHLIDYTAQGPNVRLVVIGLVLPNLGTCIVRSSSLGVE